MQHCNFIQTRTNIPVQALHSDLFLRYIYISPFKINNTYTFGKRVDLTCRHINVWLMKKQEMLSMLKGATVSARFACTNLHQLRVDIRCLKEIRNHQYMSALHLSHLVTRILLLGTLIKSETWGKDPKCYYEAVEWGRLNFKFVEVCITYDNISLHFECIFKRWMLIICYQVCIRFVLGEADISEPFIYDRLVS